jgi:transcriptional repressor NrdR
VQCPYCGDDSQVVDSRQNADGVRRRRTCNGCRRRFTTYEKVAPPNIKVVKRSGKSEPFDPDKIARVLARVCRDRGTLTPADVERIARTLEAQLLDERVKSIRSAELVARVLARLGEVDRLAYARLAADYIGEDGHLRTEPRAQAATDPSQIEMFGPDEDPEP